MVSMMTESCDWLAALTNETIDPPPFKPPTPPPCPKYVQPTSENCVVWAENNDIQQIEGTSTAL